MSESERFTIVGRGWQELVPTRGLPFDPPPSAEPAAPDVSRLLVGTFFDQFDWEGTAAAREIPWTTPVERFFTSFDWD